MEKKNEQLTLNDKAKFDSKGGSVLGILEGPVADFAHSTRNGRHYSEELWENVLKNPLVQEQFKNGGIVGELDHPVDRDDICTEKVAVLMRQPPVKKDGKYFGKFDILDTPCGRIVYTLAKAGFKLGVSSRGTGDVDDYTDEVDPSSYDFTCFDVVLLPAVESARMKLVTESFDKKKVNYKKLLKEDINRSTPEEQKIMEETLNNIGITLDEELEKKTLAENKETEDKPEEELAVSEKEPIAAPEVEETAVEEVAVEEPTVDEIAVEEPVVDTATDEIASETCADIEDDKLVELLHAFLDSQGLELDGTGDEEKQFVELFHQIVCPEDVIKEPEEGLDIKPEDAQDTAEEVDDVESDELIEQLQKMLRENRNLTDELQRLQADKAVSNAKVVKLNEELNTFKSIAASAGKKALEMKGFEAKVNTLTEENASLKEQLEKGNERSKLFESRISKLVESKKAAESAVCELENKNKELEESIRSATTSTDQKLTEAKGTIAKAKRLIEQYKGLAHDNANRYIEMKARSLGISKNEILNRLNESYTLDDVDVICDDLKDYSLNLSSLPFAFDKPGKAKVRMREDHRRDPLKNVDSGYDDTVDDYLLDLAGLPNTDK